MKTPLRILNLEDNRNDAELNHAILESAGIACETVVVETQEAYLSALGQGGWDLILADYALPEFDGVAALDLARERCPETPFIFVSGALGEEIAIESLKRGATDYVLKEQLSRLAPAVRRALQERDAQLARQRAEAEVISLKNYLANIIDSMPSILVGIDRHETVTQWNRRAEELTGISAAAAIGRPIPQVLPDFSSWIAALRRNVEQQRHAVMEQRVIEKEGEHRFYDLMLYPLLTNCVEGAVIRIEDVTEQTRLQDLMIQTEKMVSIGGLAAGMAHEINNPLSIITQAVQNIERRVSPDLPANRQAADALGVSLERMQTYFAQRQIPEFLGSIRTAASRAARIVANMLQFSRRAETAIQPASLADILERAIEFAASDYDLKKKYDFRNIAIIRDYAPEMPEVMVVMVEIEQVLLNLLKNAAQAMIVNPPDRPPRITLRLRCEDRYAVAEVEDNGPGMDETIRRRVFEPFFTTKEPGIGTGLGLSVSYMIITQNHKGLIEVASTPGNGACFTVRLPLASQTREDTS